MRPAGLLSSAALILWANAAHAGEAVRPAELTPVVSAVSASPWVESALRSQLGSLRADGVLPSLPELVSASRMEPESARLAAAQVTRALLAHPESVEAHVVSLRGLAGVEGTSALVAASWQFQKRTGDAPGSALASEISALRDELKLAGAGGPEALSARLAGLFEQARPTHGLDPALEALRINELARAGGATHGHANVGRRFEERAAAAEPRDAEAWRELAHEAYAAAALRGDAFARDRLVVVEQAMTRSQIAASRRLALKLGAKAGLFKVPPVMPPTYDSFHPDDRTGIHFFFQNVKRQLKPRLYFGATWSESIVEAAPAAFAPVEWISRWAEKFAEPRGRFDRVPDEDDLRHWLAVAAFDYRVRPEHRAPEPGASAARLLELQQGAMADMIQYSIDSGLAAADLVILSLPCRGMWGYDGCLLELTRAVELGNEVALYLEWPKPWNARLTGYIASRGEQVRLLKRERDVLGFLKERAEERKSR